MALEHREQREVGGRDRAGPVVGVPRSGVEQRPGPGQRAAQQGQPPEQPVADRTRAGRGDLALERRRPPDLPRREQHLDGAEGAALAVVGVHRDGGGGVPQVGDVERRGLGGGVPGDAFEVRGEFRVRARGGGDAVGQGGATPDERGGRPVQGPASRRRLVAVDRGPQQGVDEPDAADRSVPALGEQADPDPLVEGGRGIVDRVEPRGRRQRGRVREGARFAEHRGGHDEGLPGGARAREPHEHHRGEGARGGQHVGGGGRQDLGGELLEQRPGVERVAARPGPEPLGGPRRAQRVVRWPRPARTARRARGR